MLSTDTKALVAAEKVKGLFVQLSLALVCRETE